MKVGEKLDDDEYQWSKRKWTTCDMHRPNQFEQILVLVKIDAQREFEIDEKQSKHQTLQQEGNTTYILYVHQQK